MGNITGFACDRPGCETVELGATHRPKGWLQLTIDAGERVTSLDLCSNRCLLTLAAERCQDVDGLPVEIIERRGKSQRRVSEAGRESIKAGSNRRFHRQGLHDAEPRVGCPDCEAVTAPSNG